MSDIDVIKIILANKELGIALPLLAVAVTYGDRLIKMAESLGLLKIKNNQPKAVPEAAQKAVPEAAQKAVPEAAQKAVPEAAQAPTAMKIDRVIHSYGLTKCWGQNSEDVFKQIDGFVALSRECVWECAFDLSAVVSMNRPSHDGFTKAFREARRINNVGITIVFPRDIEKKGQHDPLLVKLYQELSTECVESHTIKVIKDERAPTSLRYDVSISYLPKNEDENETKD